MVKILTIEIYRTDEGLTWFSEQWTGINGIDKNQIEIDAIRDSISDIINKSK